MPRSQMMSSHFQPALEVMHGGTVHQAVENGVHAGYRQAFVAGPVAPGAAVLENLVGIFGHDKRVVVE